MLIFKKSADKGMSWHELQGKVGQIALCF